MIISEKWKCIFLGLPFSASSAISKELVERYDGKPLFGKHSSIANLIYQYKDIGIYIVFSIYRSPLDICFSKFTKLAESAHSAYTNMEFLSENGGWISNRESKIYHCLQDYYLDFESYIAIRTQYTLSMNLKQRVFGPHYYYSASQAIKVPIHSLLLYRIVQPLRFAVWKQRDVARRRFRVAPDYRLLADQSDDNS